jgi:hypothetical protein
MVTIDAMGAQEAIAEGVIRGEADYLLAPKGNHEALHRAVIEHIDERLEGTSRGPRNWRRPTAGTAARKSGPICNCRPPVACLGRRGGTA